MLNFASTGEPSHGTELSDGRRRDHLVEEPTQENRGPHEGFPRKQVHHVLPGKSSGARMSSALYTELHMWRDI